VKFFRPERGFGFIIPDDGDGELFFHYSIVTGREPEQNDAVLYSSGMRNGKPAALSVKVLSE